MRVTESARPNKFKYAIAQKKAQGIPWAFFVKLRDVYGPPTY